MLTIHETVSPKEECWPASPPKATMGRVTRSCKEQERLKREKQQEELEQSEIDSDTLSDTHLQVGWPQFPEITDDLADDPLLKEQLNLKKKELQKTMWNKVKQLAV